MSSATTGHLSHCLECGYSLEGLPTHHRCPECGWEYDQYTRVWRRRGRWLTVRELCVSLIVVIHFAAGFAFGFTVSPLAGMIIQVFVVFVFVCVIIVRWRCYSKQRQGDFAAITSEGIRVRQYEMLEPVLIRWKEIEEIEPSKFGRMCRVMHRSTLFDGEVSDESELVGMFDTKEDVRTFAEHAKARWSLLHEEEADQDIKHSRTTSSPSS